MCSEISEVNTILSGSWSPLAVSGLLGCVLAFLAAIRSDGPNAFRVGSPLLGNCPAAFAAYRQVHEVFKVSQ